MICMASVKISGFDSLDQFFAELKHPEKMAKKAVDAASTVLENSLKTEIKRAANRKDADGKPYSTGELAASINSTKAKENHLGVYAVVKPEGIDSRGVRNVEKLAYLEYGVASHGQLPHPVRQKAVNAAEEECEQIMRDVIYREVGRL